MHWQRHQEGDLPDMQTKQSCRMHKTLPGSASPLSHNQDLLQMRPRFVLQIHYGRQAGCLTWR